MSTRSSDLSLHELQTFQPQMNPDPSSGPFTAPHLRRSDSFQRFNEGLQFCDIAVRDDVDHQVKGLATGDLSLYSVEEDMEGLRRILQVWFLRV